MSPPTRNCVHLVTGAVTYYTVFPLLYAQSIFSFAARVVQIRRGTKRKKYRNTKPNGEKDPYESQAFLHKHLQEMETEKHHGWTQPSKPRVLSMIPDYEPPDYVQVVEPAAAGDTLLPGNGHLKPSRHSRIPSVSSALHYYFDITVPSAA